jgi:hypothetical protein
MPLILLKFFVALCCSVAVQTATACRFHASDSHPQAWQLVALRSATATPTATRRRPLVLLKHLALGVPNVAALQQIPKVAE